MEREGLDETDSDCYGMFATMKVKRGETILREGKITAERDCFEPCLLEKSDARC